MNLLVQQGRTFVGQSICRRCLVQMTSSCFASPSTAQHSSKGKNGLRRYHNIRLETVSEAWQQLKKEFKSLRRASANQPPHASAYDLGAEIGTSIFLIKGNASVHFTNGRWYGTSKEGRRRVVYPGQEAVGFVINAIDARGTLLDQTGFNDIIKLKSVKFLNVESCQYVDDACLAHLVHLRDSLTHLNINNCPRVTENGVATLHKLRKLEQLNMSDLTGVRYPKLVASMLEDVLPRLRVNIISHLVDKEKSRSRQKMPEEELQQNRTESV